MALKLIYASSFQKAVDYSYFLCLPFFWQAFKMSSLACYDIVYELKPVVQANCWSWNQGLNNSGVLSACGLSTAENRAWRALEKPWNPSHCWWGPALPGPGWTDPSLTCSSLLLWRAHGFLLHIIFFFPTNHLSKTQRYSFLKNINISHCSWIHVCFAQPTAGEESSPTSSQKCPFSLLELGLTKSLTVLSIFPDFHQRKRKKENFGGWHMGTILPFLQEGPRPA